MTTMEPEADAAAGAGWAAPAAVCAGFAAGAGFGANAGVALALPVAAGGFGGAAVSETF